MDFVSYKFHIASILPGSLSFTHCTSILIESEVPYRVAVRARTSKGLGERAAIDVFSKEGGITNNELICVNLDCMNKI